jgi:hypothetical protein
MAGKIGPLINRFDRQSEIAAKHPEGSTRASVCVSGDYRQAIAA